MATIIVFPRAAMRHALEQQLPVTDVDPAAELVADVLELAEMETMRRVISSTDTVASSKEITVSST